MPGGDQLRCEESAGNLQPAGIQKVDDTRHLYPKDGYRVEEFDTHKGELILNLTLRINGELQWNKTLGHWAKDGSWYRGQRRRRFLLWQAICHYLNSGGEREYIENLHRGPFGRHIDVTDDDGLKTIFELPELQPLPGFYLLDSEPLEEDLSRFEHTFIDDKGRAIVWTEDLEVRMTTIAQLENEVDEMTEALGDEQIAGVQCAPDSGCEDAT